MINQRSLQHLLILMKYAHFGRAARALNISQPALTKSIQALEADLGATLLDRRRGALTLTVFGELVIERSKSLLTPEEDLRREIGLLAGHETGSLKIALGPYPSVTSGYAGIARLHALHPKIGISVHVTGWREVANQVTARTVDLGIAEIGGLAESEQFTTELIAQHRAHIFCRPGHPVLKRGRVSLLPLLDFPWVATRLPARIARGLPASLGASGMIDPINGDFVPAIEIDVPMQISEFLAESNAIAFASLSMMEVDLKARRVVVVPTKGLNFQAGYGFIYLKNRSLAPATLAYMQEVRAVESELVKKEKALEAIYVSPRKKATLLKG